MLGTPEPQGPHAGDQPATSKIIVSRRVELASPIQPIPFRILESLILREFCLCVASFWQCFETSGLVNWTQKSKPTARAQFPSPDSLRSPARSLESSSICSESDPKIQGPSANRRSVSRGDPVTPDRFTSDYIGCCWRKLSGMAVTVL